MGYATAVRSQAELLREWGRTQRLDGLDDREHCADAAAELARRGLLDLPLPGGGDTAARFEALAALGELDLGLARLGEGHADAAAIRHELGAPAPATGELWGVWAADPPGERVQATRIAGRWLLAGRKPWCSGAYGLSHALVTAHAEDGYRLFAVDLTDNGVRPVAGSWDAFALSGTDSGAVCFDAARAWAVGGPGAYLERSGFWHGAIGVAAVWLGGAEAVAAELLRKCSRSDPDEHSLAHAGAVDATLHAARAVLDDAAAAIDADPDDAANAGRVRAYRARAVVEHSATTVLHRVGRALGASPMSRYGHGRRVADLDFYLRQSNAERDLAELGRRVCAGQGPAG